MIIPKEIDNKLDEIEHNRRIKIMLETMLRIARNDYNDYSIFIGPKPTNKSSKSNDVLVTLNEFQIHKAEHEIFLSIKIDNKFNRLSEKDFEKEVESYTKDMKNLFDIRCKPKINKFHILYSLWIIHATYKLPKKQFDDLMNSAEMLAIIKKSSI